MYKLTDGGIIKRLSDGAFIPMANGNRDYHDYLAWLSAGNTPQPAFSLDERRLNRIAKLEAHEDAMIESVIPARLKLRVIAESLALIDKAAGGGGRTAEEEIKTNSRRAMWGKIAAIHAQADAKRTEILAAGDPESVDIALTMPQ